MAAPNLTGEFNGVSKMFMGLLMWIFGLGGQNGGQGNSLLDMLKQIFTGGSAPSDPASTTPTPTPTQPSTTTTSTSTSSPTPTPTPTTAPQTTHKLVTFGDSLAQGYGQGLTKEFGAANVTNYGVVGAGLLGGTHLANVDWTTVKDATVLMSIGTNDVGFLSAKNPSRIDSYAQQVVGIAAKVAQNGGTPVIVAMRAPDKPLTIKDPITKQDRPQTPEEFQAWKDTLAKMNDSIARAAAASNPPIKVVTPEGGTYVAGGVHQTAQGYQNTADNALKQAGITVNA